MNNNFTYAEKLENMYKNLYRVAASRSINDADDIVHDTMIYLVKNKTKYEFHENLEAFAVWKLKNIIIDRFRSESKKSDMVDDQNVSNAEGLFSDEEDEEMRIKKMTLYDGLKKISQDCQTILNLQISGNNYESISNILSIEVGTVGSRLARCTDALKGVVNGQ